VRARSQEVLEVVFAGVLCYTGLSAQVLGEKEFNLVVTPIHPPRGHQGPFKDASILETN
jgi:hypothetical protein